MNHPRIPEPWFRSRECLYPIEHGLTLENKFVIPDFQRGIVWTQEQNIRFIESIWMNLPIGSYCLNRTISGKCDGWLIDGQQRWNAIRLYTASAFQVFDALYTELDISDQRRFKRTHVFVCNETRYEDESILRDIYERLAYGGTPNLHLKEVAS